MSDNSQKKREISDDDDDDSPAGGRQNSKRLKIKTEHKDDAQIIDESNEQRMGRLLMSDMESDEQIAVNTLWEISRLLVSEELTHVENMKLFISLGGTTVVLKAMKKHHNSMYTQVLGLCIICKSVDNRREEMFSALGLHVSVLATMKRFATDINVQTMGCCFLMQLTYRSGLVNLLAGQPDGIPTVIEAMKRFPNDPQVQLCGCGALLNISSCKNMTYNKKIEQTGGLVALTEAKLNHPDDERIQEDARGALKNVLGL